MQIGGHVVTCTAHAWADSCMCWCDYCSAWYVATCVCAAKCERDIAR